MNQHRVIIAFGVTTVAVVFLVYGLWRPADRRLTDEEARRLLHQKNVAIGQLENQQLEQSIPVFREIARLLPDDSLGARNLAVARVVVLGEEFQHATPGTLRQAREALNSVRATEGESTPYRWLLARVAAASGDNTGAAASLNRIVGAEPENAAAWFELFQLQRDESGTDMRSALDALDRAVSLAPENLFLWMEYFRQADEQLPSIGHTSSYANLLGRLETAKRTLAPFQYELDIAGGPNVRALLDEASEAVRSNDLLRGSDRLGQVSRLILPLASADLAQIRRHPLEFMLDRFDQDFYRRFNLSEVTAPPAIDVQFVADEMAIPDEVIGDRMNIEQMSLADFDLDGRLDVLFVNGDELRAVGRATGGDQWRLIARADVPSGTRGVILQDFDLDFDESRPATPRSGAPTEGQLTPEEDCLSADVDVAVYGNIGVRLFRNVLNADSRDRTLVPIEQSPGELSNVRAAAAADVDGDGDLDLVMAAEQGLSVWSNRGNGTFAEITSRSQLDAASEPVMKIVPVDLDRDLDIDFVVAISSGLAWLENLRHGRLRARVLEGMRDLDGIEAFEVIDANNDGSWDLVAADRAGLHLITTEARGIGGVRIGASTKISDVAATQIQSWDYDNDGMVDLIVILDDSPVVYRGLTEGRFTRVDFEMAPRGARSCAAGDLDNDGDLDLCSADASGITWLRNEGGNQNQWLEVALKARQIKGGQSSASGRVNAYGVGSLLELKVGAGYQARMVRGQTTHFGLGQQANPDLVRVSWLNGVPQNLIQPETQRTVCEQQVLTGSCPYLYAWNGQSFEFVTDLLWAAPLGLQVADGTVAPSREWEYLKISGDQLAPKNGKYVLQITEELWEAAYFDQVKLLAVDHPADVAIYSNEKVGSAEMARFKVHTVRTPRAPVAARNHRGRDILDEISKGDEVYSKAFDRKLCQGLAEDHHLELDLGNLGNAKQVTLFLSGWIYPSGTSVSVGISQNSDLATPKPPSLSVPDGNGGWREALPFMGYPGGKTKTIAIDLSGLFTHGDYRVRIATNLELYWDQIFFTVDETDVEVRLSELVLRKADLHPRGFSRIEHRPHHGPERFLYDHVTTEPKWPPMQGRFTRFGDVSELVGEADDRLLVIGAGDEVTLRFDASLGDLPRGWKRDFLLYSVGWDKDANLCTVVGQTVEPLPFRSMTAYPPTESGPKSEAHQDYLQTYQTREQTRSFWEHVRRYEPASSN